MITYKIKKGKNVLGSYSIGDNGCINVINGDGLRNIGVRIGQVEYRTRAKLTREGYDWFLVEDSCKRKKKRKDFIHPDKTKEF